MTGLPVTGSTAIGHGAAGGGARKWRPLPLLGVLALLAGSCAEPSPGPAPPSEPVAARAPETPAPETPAPGAPAPEAPAPQSPFAQTPVEQSADGAPVEQPTVAPLVVFLGDSLTAGLGVGEEEAFPEQVRRRLAAEGVRIRVVNAGVSGDTTAGGLARLDWVLRQQPQILVVGLGANDGLRGLALGETEANLRAIVAGARRAGARVLLLGMLLPPNYGPEYTAGFRDIFPRLAAELEVPLVPFLLTGIAGIPELNQADGIHPTAAGHRLMAENVLPGLRQMLAAAG